MFTSSYSADDLKRIDNWYGRIGKPLIDRTLAVLLLVSVSPVLLFTALAIKWTSPGPVFYKQIRSGRHGKPFHLLKFRSMVIQHDDPSRQAYLGDPRITAVGHIIRRLKIDELPQLWHVIAGEMSLVGPRPTLPDQMNDYTPAQYIRYEVLPGLTGWAQVKGNILLSVYERREHDVYYVKNLSFGLDMKILLKTIGVVLFGEKLTKI